MAYCNWQLIFNTELFNCESQNFSPTQAYNEVCWTEMTGFIIWQIRFALKSDEQDLFRSKIKWTSMNVSNTMYFTLFECLSIIHQLLIWTCRIDEKSFWWQTCCSRAYFMNHALMFFKINIFFPFNILTMLKLFEDMIFSKALVKVHKTLWNWP